MLACTAGAGAGPATAGAPGASTYGAASAHMPGGMQQQSYSQVGALGAVLHSPQLLVRGVADLADVADPAIDQAGRLAGQL